MSGSGTGFFFFYEFISYMMHWALFAFSKIAKYFLDFETAIPVIFSALSEPYKKY